MPYTVEKKKKGIKLHLIDTSKFKTNLMAVCITTPLNREFVTYDSLIPAVLKRGTNNLKTQEEISIKLEEMYGAEFDCGIEKIGDNHVLKFYFESLNDNFIPRGSSESILKESVNMLLDIIFNPIIENDSFKNEYVEAEKNNIKILIESRIDNRDQYALSRCIEEMYKNRPYGLYKFGYTEDLDKINADNLYKYYKELIKTSKIDIFISGDIEKENVKKIVKNNENIKRLNGRNPRYIIDSDQEGDKDKTKEENKVQDKMDVSQGKLVIGLDVDLGDYDSKFPVYMYNVILRRKCNI